MRIARQIERHAIVAALVVEEREEVVPVTEVGAASSFRRYMLSTRRERTARSQNSRPEQRSSVSVDSPPPSCAARNVLVSESAGEDLPGGRLASATQ